MVDMEVFITGDGKAFLHEQVAKDYAATANNAVVTYMVDERVSLEQWAASKIAFSGEFKEDPTRKKEFQISLVHANILRNSKELTITQAWSSSKFQFYIEIPVDPVILRSYKDGVRDYLESLEVIRIPQVPYIALQVEKSVIEAHLYKILNTNKEGVV